MQTVDSVRLRQVAICSFFAVLFAATLQQGYANFSDTNDWTIGDWLINYQGGFVRRGLGGELFLELGRAFHLSPSIFVLATQYICYALLFFYACRLLLQQKSIGPFILILISPAVFLFHIHDPQGGFRKEILFFALFAPFAFYSLSRPQVIKLLLPAILLVYPFLVLTHEMLVLFLPYFFALWYLHTRPSARALLGWVILSLLSLISFYLAVVYKGNYEQAVAICQSLGADAPDRCTEMGAIKWLRYSTEEGLGQAGQALEFRDYLTIYPVALLLSLIAFIPLADRIKALVSKRIPFAMIVASYLGTIPLCMVALDWGRFIYIHLLATSLVLMTLNGGDNDTLPKASSSTRNPLVMIYRLFHQQRVWSYPAVIVSVIYAVSWHMPHCCGRGITPTHIQQLLSW